MDFLRVQIVRFVSDTQPGVVAAEFEDVNQRIHTLVDKVPIFTEVELDEKGPYPCHGAVRCAIERRWKEAGVTLVEVSTETPDHVESEDGLTKFVVLADNVYSD